MTPTPAQRSCYSIHKTMMMTINLVICTCLKHIKSTRKLFLFGQNLFKPTKEKRWPKKINHRAYTHIIIGANALLYTISDQSIRTDVYSLPNCNPSLFSPSFTLYAPLLIRKRHKNSLGCNGIELERSKFFVFVKFIKSKKSNTQSGQSFRRLLQLTIAYALR